MESEHTSQTPISVNDQIAALYLRNKDTLCTQCGYNRRDSARCACPECGTDLVLTPGNEHAESQLNTLARFCVIMVMIIAGVECLGLAYWFFAYTRYYMMPGSDRTIILAGLTAVGWLVFVIAPLALLLRARRPHRSMAMTTAMACMISVVSYSVLVKLLWEIYNAMMR